MDTNNKAQVTVKGYHGDIPKQYAIRISGNSPEGFFYAWADKRFPLEKQFPGCWDLYSGNEVFRRQ